MPYNERTMVLAAWLTVGCWLLYGLVALAGVRPPINLPPPTALPADKLEVTVTKGAAARKCHVDANGLGHFCSDDVWHHVSAYAGRANGKPTRCIWVHPPKSGETLTLKYTAVPLAAEVSATLVLMPGSNDGAAVQAKMSVDGRQIGRLQARSERLPARLWTHIGADEKPRNLTIEVKTSNSKWRLACLSLQAAAEETGRRNRLRSANGQ